MRPVIKFKKLNKWVKPQHLTIEGMDTLKELLRVNNWMVKVDLKNAYFTIPIHTNHQPFLRFRVGQQHYQFTCLPFGLSYVPWVFTEVMKPLAIQSMGYVCMIVYINNILLMAESINLVNRSGLCHQHTQVNHDPHSTDRVSGSAGGFYLPTIKLTRGETLPHQDGDQSELIEVPGNSGSINWEAACNFTCNSSCSPVLPIPTWRPSESTEPQQLGLQRTAVHITSGPAQKELRWWQEKLSQCNGKALIHRTTTVIIISSDASLQG